MTITKTVALHAITTTNGNQNIAVASTSDQARSLAEFEVQQSRIEHLTKKSNISVIELPGIRLAVMSLALVLVALSATPAFAWGDENWGSSNSTVVVVSGGSPDYLQQRIDTRKQRATYQRYERARTLQVVRENDRRIEREQTTKALGAAGVALSDYMNGVEVSAPIDPYSTDLGVEVEW